MLDSRELSLLDNRIFRGEPHFWPNPLNKNSLQAFERAASPKTLADHANGQWKAFGPLLSAIFPELVETGGKIASPMFELPMIEPSVRKVLNGRVLMKADHLLPLTGTIKARGGVYEVLQYARSNAVEHQLFDDSMPIEHLASDTLRAHFSKFRVVTGSTGNLGYSVSLAARALGFQVEIHMSRDAKAWKVDRLRGLGVSVKQHDGDYSVAVAAARAASNEAKTYFVDDENSLALFEGYSAAAFEVADQINEFGIEVSTEHPLIVYLPCGVGGAPGGVAFGLKNLYGDAVSCILAEPVSAPSVLLQTAIGAEKPVTVYDIGLKNQTIADGLAVPSASLLVVKHIRHMIDGFATVSDEALLQRTRELHEKYGYRIEPSAVAGYDAFHMLAKSDVKPESFARATHLVWTTGGSQLPDAEFARILS